MRATNWGALTNPDVVNRRAGGRRHHNAVRQFRAHLRRNKLVDVLAAERLSPFERGTQANLSRLLKVSRSTISRDVATLMNEMREREECPICGNQMVLLPFPNPR